MLFPFHPEPAFQQLAPCVLSFLPSGIWRCLLTCVGTLSSPEILPCCPGGSVLTAQAPVAMTVLLSHGQQEPQKVTCGVASSFSVTETLS